MEFINRNREELIEAWLAKTGLQPDQCQLVQQDMGRKMNFWVEARTDRCLTHRSDIEALRARLDELVKMALSFLSEEGMREHLSAYVQGCRFMELLAHMEKN